MTPNQLRRFEAKYVTEPNCGCWLWDGCVNSQGYAQLARDSNHRGSMLYAHRLSYEHYVGPIPVGMDVCHKCDVRCCVNPEHLFVGTRTDNMRDANQKGRHAHGLIHGLAKLTVEMVWEIRRTRAAGKPLAELARRLGISKGSAYRVANGAGWTHVACECGAAFGVDHDCELDLITVDGEDMHPTEEPQ